MISLFRPQHMLHHTQHACCRAGQGLACSAAADNVDQAAPIERQQEMRMTQQLFQREPNA